ncbi:MAG: triple tyrosine motif-containing protein [Candidatus Cyclobacteriaceae bacterium M3_2C_046]
MNRPKIILFILLVWALHPAYGQYEQLKYYNINDIPSRELIKSISKDHKGFVWLATDQGVIRYNGTDTDLFYKSFPTPYTKAFLKRKNGQFLVLHDLGLFEIINNEDTTIFKVPEIYGYEINQSLNYPKTIYEDQQEDIWIGEFNAIVRIDQTGMKRFELDDSFRSINYHRTFAFSEDAFDNLWITSFNGQLLYYDPATRELEQVVLDHQLTEVSFLVTLQGDYLLMGGAEGILKIKVDSDRNILNEQFIDDLTQLSSAIVTENDNLFIGTWLNGLYEMDINGADYHVTPLNMIGFNDILDFHYDTGQKELWITGSENVGLFKPTIINIIEPVGRNRIESISLDQNQQIYYSVGQTMLMLPGLNTDQVKEVFHSERTYFDQILIEDRLVWIGDAFGSIFSYHLDQKELTNYQPNSNSAISHIFLDQKGNKWFSGANQWVTRISPAFEVFQYEQVPQSRVVKQSSEGKIFASSRGKDSLLYAYDPVNDSFDPISLDYSFEPDPDIQIEDMFFDQNDNLWLASDQGILKIAHNQGNYNQVERLEVTGIDPSEPARSIVVADGKIWFANSMGLVVYQDEKATIYTNENGLPSKILKDRGLVINQDGDLLVATAKGMALLHVDQEKFNKTPKPMFKNVRVDDHKYAVSQGQEVIIPYNVRLNVEYITLSFPGKNISYQSRIEGMDPNWSRASKNNNLSIYGFSEGQYLLEVRARDGGSLWSDPLALSFTVATPWFKTWWAYSLSVILIAIITVVAMKLYNQHLLRQKRKLQAVIEARTAEINQQKNEIIGQKNKLIQQKEELLSKNKSIFESQQALSEADLKYLHLKEKQLQDQIDFKNKQVTTHTLNIIQKNETLKGLRDRIDKIIKSPNGSTQAELKKTLKLIDDSFKLDKDWEEFRLYFEQVYTGFYSKLKVNTPDLTNQELRHCALIRLNLNIAECASILGISPDSVKVSRTRLRKKLGLQNGQSLSDFIMSI